jgi:hypothetical protein
MSTQPLTEAEQAAAVVLAARHNASDATHSYSSAAFHGDARAVVAAVRSSIEADALDAFADAIDAYGPASADHTRGVAFMVRQGRTTVRDWLAADQPSTPR